MLEPYQPSDRCLELLADPCIVRGDCAITYAEISIDFMTVNKRRLKRLRQYFNHHLVFDPKPTNTHYYKVEKTAYFTPAEAKHRLALYDDLPARKSPKNYAAIFNIDLVD